MPRSRRAGGTHMIGSARGPRRSRPCGSNRPIGVAITGAGNASEWVSVTCPACGVVRVRADLVVVRNCLDDQSWSYRTRCSSCETTFVGATPSWLARPAVAAGLAIELWTLPAAERAPHRVAAARDRRARAPPRVARIGLVRPAGSGGTARRTVIVRSGVAFRRWSPRAGTRSSRSTGTPAPRCTTTSPTSRRAGTTSSTRGRTAYVNPFADLLAATAYRNWDSERRLEGDGVAGRRRRGAVPEHGAAVLRAGQPHRAGADRRRLRAPLGRAAGAQPLARRLLRGGAGPARRHRADLPQRRRRRARRGPLGEGEHATCSAAILLPNVAPNSAAAAAVGSASTSRSGTCARSSTSSCNIHSGQRPARLRRARSRAGDHADRDRVVRAPRGVAPDLRRRARAPPEPARRAHRAGHGLDPARARHARLVPPPHDARRRGRGRVLRRGRRSSMSLTPSEYFQRNFWVGASFLRPSESELRYEVGVDRIMWGADYPHSEGSLPVHDRGAARRVRAVPARRDDGRCSRRPRPSVYGFDLDDAARRSATGSARPSPRCCEPLDPADYPADSTCNAFDAEQVVKSW